MKPNIGFVKTILCFFLCVLAVSFPAWGDEFSGKSPSGKIAFESKNAKEFCIWAAASPNKRVLLYHEETVFIQAAAISPDDVWIALEQGGSSLGHTILFFKREKGLVYKRVGGGEKDADPADKVGAFAVQSKGFKENVLDHSYLHPIEWAADSKWLTVALDGKGGADGKHVQITNWRCRYNPVTAEVQALKDNPGRIEITPKQ